MSSSVPAIIDYIIEAEAHGKPVQQKPSVILYALSANPHVFQDSAKNELSINKNSLESYLNIYNKIEPGSSVLLENCEVHPSYGKNREVISCEIISKTVTLDVNTEKQIKQKNFEIKLSLSAVDGVIPVLPSTRRLLRRMEKTEFFKKNAGKRNTVEITNFVQPQKADKKAQQKKVDNYVVLPTNIEPLDTNSASILRTLLPFVDKEELLKLLIKKPLKDKSNKKAVRMMVIPTDSEDNDTMEVRKKRYQKNEIHELLAEYESREERMRL